MRITTILLAHSKNISQMDTHVVDTNTQKHKRNECVNIGYLVGIIFLTILQMKLDCARIVPNTAY